MWQLNGGIQHGQHAALDGGAGQLSLLHKVPDNRHAPRAGQTVLLRASLVHEDDAMGFRIHTGAQSGNYTPVQVAINMICNILRAAAGISEMSYVIRPSFPLIPCITNLYAMNHTETGFSLSVC